MRDTIIVGYMLKNLEPYLDQTVPDGTIDQVIETCRTGVEEILQLDEEELLEYGDNLFRSVFE